MAGQPIAFTRVLVYVVAAIITLWRTRKQQRLQNNSTHLLSRRSVPLFDVHGTETDATRNMDYYETHVKN